MVRLSTSGIVSRSTLRDCQNRLRKVGMQCGDMAEMADLHQDVASGDFTDMMKRFNTRMGEVLTLIKQRNDEERRNGVKTDIARMSHDVNMGIKDVKSQRDAIKALLEKAERELAKTNKKYSKKKDGLDDAQQKKLRDREQAAKDRRRAVDNCNEAVEQIEKLNAERGMSAKDIAINQRSTKRVLPPGAANPGLLKYLEEAKRRQARHASRGESPEPEGSDDPTTAEALASYARLKAQEDAALLRLELLAKQLEDDALRIQASLKEQVSVLDEIQGEVDDVSRDVTRMNRGLNAVLRRTKPMNVVINVICVLFVLAVVGLVLSEIGWL